jgi:DNA-directed RNA polymerase specialized sigma subunit
MIKDLNLIMNDYKPNYSIFSEDEHKMFLIKKALLKLSEADRIIFILYAELGSLRKTGKALGVSHTTAYKQIKMIKEQILNDIGCTTD